MAAAGPIGGRLFAFTTRGSRRFSDVAWQPGDWLVFGSETAGLPGEMRAGQRSVTALPTTGGCACRCAPGSAA
jgi:tRNA(Leu) C34 or U34 (ribose-2'-O)-methylase TrmL